MLTFCIGSTTVARLLERNLGIMLEVAFRVDSRRVSALEEEHFNMVEVLDVDMIAFSLPGRGKIFQSGGSSVWSFFPDNSPPALSHVRKKRTQGYRY
jgi:hypothetical protein